MNSMYSNFTIKLPPKYAHWIVESVCWQPQKYYQNFVTTSNRTVYHTKLSRKKVFLINYSNWMWKTFWEHLLFECQSMTPQKVLDLGVLFLKFNRQMIQTTYTSLREIGNSRKSTFSRWRLTPKKISLEKFSKSVRAKFFLVVLEVWKYGTLAKNLLAKRQFQRKKSL